MVFATWAGFAEFCLFPGFAFLKSWLIFENSDLKLRPELAGWGAETLLVNKCYKRC